MLVPDRFPGGVPSSIILRHGVQDDEHFAHAGDHCDFMGLASGDEALIKGANDWIAAPCGYGSHVEGLSNLCTPAPDAPLAFEFAAVAIEGSHTHQGADLLAVQLAELRQARHEHT